MRLTGRLALGVSVIAALLPFVAAASAAAETETMRDAVGDTSSEDGPGRGQATADVLRFRSHHGAWRVTTRLDVAAVRDGGEFYATVVLRTDEGTRYGIYFGRGERGDARSLDVVRGSRATGTLVRCPGARARLALDREAARISVPRRCLGSPDWVRTGALVETRPPQGGVFTDDARRDGGAAENQVELGARRLRSGR